MVLCGFSINSCLQDINESSLDFETPCSAWWVKKAQKSSAQQHPWRLGKTMSGGVGAWLLELFLHSWHLQDLSYVSASPTSGEFFSWHSEPLIASASVRITGL